MRPPGIWRGQSCPEVASGSSSGGVTTTPVFVTDRLSGVSHRVLLVPPDMEIAVWATFCGWAFGKGTMAKFVEEVSLSSDPKLLC